MNRQQFRKAQRARVRKAQCAIAQALSMPKSFSSSLRVTACRLKKCATSVSSTPNANHPPALRSIPLTHKQERRYTCDPKAFTKFID